jgi:N-acetylglucosamine malate deacetylase 2
MRIRILYIICLAYLSGCSSNRVDFNAIALKQDAQLPLWEIPTNTHQHALFVFPHPDDEITCAGTMAALKENGWQVSLLTLTKGLDEQNKQLREKEWLCAAAVMQYDTALLFDFYNNTWSDILANNLVYWNEHRNDVKNVIYEAMLQIQPDIVFTYDTEIGGYGHPEHKITAELVAEIFNEDSTGVLKVTSLMQMTLPDALETFLVGSVESYPLALERYHTKGLPNPSVAVAITNYWPTKHKAASCYASQAEILNKFYLLPSNTDTTKHYNTFNREYYLQVKR